jgi:hypothetical protein
MSAERKKELDSRRVRYMRDNPEGIHVKKYRVHYIVRSLPYVICIHPEAAVTTRDTHVRHTLSTWHGVFGICFLVAVFFLAAFRTLCSF